MKRSKILALAVNNNTIFCDSTRHWSSCANFIWHLTRPHNIIYDIYFLCINEVPPEEEEFKKLYKAFVTLYNNSNDWVARHNAYNYLINSKWTRSAKRGDF